MPEMRVQPTALLLPCEALLLLRPQKPPAIGGGWMSECTGNGWYWCDIAAENKYKNLLFWIYGLVYLWWFSFHQTQPATGQPKWSLDHTAWGWNAVLWCSKKLNMLSNATSTNSKHFRCSRFLRYHVVSRGVTLCHATNGTCSVSQVTLALTYNVRVDIVMRCHAVSRSVTWPRLYLHPKLYTFPLKFPFIDT